MMSEDKNETIPRHSSNAMGISPLGFSYCKIEDLLSGLATRAAVPHRHDYFVILWFTDGVGKHMVDFASYDFAPDTLFFLTRNQIHAFRPTKSIAGHIIRFSATFLRDGHPDPVTETVSLFRRHSSPACHPKGLNLNSLRTLLLLICREYEQETSFLRKEVLCALLKAFLLVAERDHSRHSCVTGVDPKLQKKFEQFMELLDEHFWQHLSVEQYAQSLRVSVRSLRLLCTAITGMSAKRIIKERVILEAQNYLTDTDLDVQEIAYRLGFEDPSYFSRYFRQQTRMSPSAYRSQSVAKVPE